MAREDLHFRLRIPEALKERVEKDAAANRRSMTAEIVHRLEESFGRDDEGVKPLWLPPELWTRVEHEAQVTEQDPNEIILDAVEKAFPSVADRRQRLKAIVKDVNRRGLSDTPEGLELLDLIERLMTEQEPSKSRWKAPQK